MTDNKFKLECDYCGKEVNGSYMDTGRFYCNPKHATLGFKRRMKEFENKIKKDIQEEKK